MLPADTIAEITTNLAALQLAPDTAALRANPDATPTQIVKIAKVSRTTAASAAHEFAKEVRKRTRKAAGDAPKPAPLPDRHERAQRFLKDTLAHGPNRVSDVEEAAQRAHVDPDSLQQARAELGIITSRANTGGAQAVQWSLPG